MRPVKDIFKLQPIQIDTVELVPGSAIEGTLGEVTDVIGTALAALVTTAKNGLPLMDGDYEIVATDAAANKFKVVYSNGFETAEIVADGTPNDTAIPGITLTVAALAGVSDNDKASFEVVGDQTYYIPGTVVGKIKEGTNSGKWQAVRSTDTLTDYSQFRVCSTFQETDKSKTVLPNGYESNLSTVFTIDVVVYGMIYENACAAINLEAVTDLKKEMPFYVWL